MKIFAWFWIPLAICVGLTVGIIAPGIVPDFKYLLLFSIFILIVGYWLLSRDAKRAGLPSFMEGKAAMDRIKQGALVECTDEPHYRFFKDLLPAQAAKELQSVAPIEARGVVALQDEAGQVTRACYYDHTAQLRREVVGWEAQQLIDRFR